jgi:hypothetical protein
LFRVLTPLPQNGPAHTWPIPWRARSSYLRHCLSYPSQRGTWIGLFPFVLLHYLLRGTQTLQPVDAARLDAAPASRAAVLRKAPLLQLGPHGPGTGRLARQHS